MPSFKCPECGRSVTRGPSGIEYGHERGRRTDEPRCPRRSAIVDPVPPQVSGRGGRHA